MAKKTNKTNHVLNLLSTGVKKEDEKKSNEVLQEDTKENIEGKNAKPNGENTAKVSVVGKEKNDIAERIRQSLEKELEEAKSAFVQEQKQQAESQNDTTQPKEQTDKSIQPKEEKIQQQQSLEQSTSSTDQAEEEEDFVIVNVMEHLVREKLLKYMEQFKCCTCKRCQADIIALAMSGLPSKYVVINKNAVSPLFNFYSVKYTGRIAVEVTKACMAVKESPRHKKINK